MKITHAIIFQQFVARFEINHNEKFEEKKNFFPKKKLIYFVSETTTTKKKLSKEFDLPRDTKIPEILLSNISNTYTTNMTHN